MRLSFGKRPGISSLLSPPWTSAVSTGRVPISTWMPTTARMPLVDPAAFAAEPGVSIRPRTTGPGRRACPTRPFARADGSPRQLPLDPGALAAGISSGPAWREEEMAWQAPGEGPAARQHAGLGRVARLAAGIRFRGRASKPAGRAGLGSLQDDPRDAVAGHDPFRWNGSCPLFHHVTSGALPT